MPATHTIRIKHPVRPSFGDGAEVRDGDGQEVQDVRHGRTVEVAIGAHAAVGQDNGVVDGRGQFAGCHEFRMVNGVTHGTGNLRGAAQRVGILHPGVPHLVGSDNRRIRQHAEHVVGAGCLAGMRTQRSVQFGQEHLVGTQQRLDA